MLNRLKSDIKKAANSKKAEIFARFFKSGPGQYAEGDVFAGIIVPQCRKIAMQYADLNLKDALSLLRSKIHEERLIALFILIDHFQRGDKKIKEKIYNLYLKNTKWINNWDLVDASAEHIIGGFLDGKQDTVLERLALSKNLWKRRIAILATFYDIKQKRYEKTFKIAEMLLPDSHDLIHKAVGWMLREVGKRCSEDLLESFLEKHCTQMPRTMLRYAIECFSESKRQKYLHSR